MARMQRSPRVEPEDWIADEGSTLAFLFAAKGCIHFTRRAKGHTHPYLVFTRLTAQEQEFLRCLTFGRAYQIDDLRSVRVYAQNDVAILVATLRKVYPEHELLREAWKRISA